MHFSILTFSNLVLEPRLGIMHTSYLNSKNVCHLPVFSLCFVLFICLVLGVDFIAQAFLSCSLIVFLCTCVVMLFTL